MVEAFIGSATIREKSFGVEETVARIQALYERRAWAIGGMFYKDLKKRVREEGIITVADYDARKEKFGWPTNPNQLSGFKSWYDLVIANPDEPRPCLNDFKDSYIIPRGILSLEDYEANPDLPPWDHLLQGYLTDYPDPLPSFLSSELFSRRGGRR
jgi:hypothetical protein